MSTPNGMDDGAVVRGVELRLDSVIGGLISALPAGITTLSMNGVVYPVADVLKTAQDLVKPWKQTRATRATLRALTATRAGDQRTANEFLADVKAALVAALGRSSQALVEFGFKPVRKAKSLTSEERLVRAAKAKLTREKRHTMGRRQKADLRETETPSIQIGPTGLEIAPTDSKAATPKTAGGDSK